jgi:hypothetical protein
MMHFKMRIELENDAMQTMRDVSRALRELANRLERDGEQGPGEGKIRDDNGNTVGSWAIEDDAT